MSTEPYVPEHLKHQTHCFRHKIKLAVIEDLEGVQPYIECPVCLAEVAKDIENIMKED